MAAPGLTETKTRFLYARSKAVIRRWIALMRSTDSGAGGQRGRNPELSDTEQLNSHSRC